MFLRVVRKALGHIIGSIHWVFIENIYQFYNVKHYAALNVREQFLIANSSVVISADEIKLTPLKSRTQTVSLSPNTVCFISRRLRIRFLYEFS